MSTIKSTHVRVRRSRGEGRVAAVFLAPFILLALAFILYPVGQAVYMSFFDFDLLTQMATNFGVQNYVQMLGGQNLTWSFDYLWFWRLLLVAASVALFVRVFTGRASQRGAFIAVAIIALVFAVILGIHPAADGRWNDPRFWAALQNTVEFTVISTPLLVGLGLALAMAVNRPGRLTVAYRTMFFLPYVLPVSVVTLIWIYLLNPGRGLVSVVTDALGLAPIDFLHSAALALPSVIFTTVWWTVGFNMVLFLAGLQDIDQHLYEAASLDGAGRWGKFVNITVPSLRRVTLLVMVTQVVASFQVFGQVYIMTRGGPGDSSLVLIQDVYQSGIRDARLGYASALSLVLLAIILVVSIAQLRFLRREP